MSQKNTMRSVQICILKVNINCKGCEEKVKKALREIPGVVGVKITNLEDGKVVALGNVDPKELLKNLKKHTGKHAEIVAHGDLNVRSIQNTCKKNDKEEGKKSKGSFLGSLFGFGEKSCKNCKNNSDSMQGHSRAWPKKIQPGSSTALAIGKTRVAPPERSVGVKHQVEASNPCKRGADRSKPSPDELAKRHNDDEGSNGNVGQMVIVNNNGSMQEHSMMNNEYHHHHLQGMQLQVQPSLYDQQQYMVNNNGAMQEYSMMNNEYHHHHHHQGMQMQVQPYSYDQQQYMIMMNQQQGNMNMYPSTMMYGGTHPSMNYNYTANPIDDENVEGCWIM